MGLTARILSDVLSRTMAAPLARLLRASVASDDPVDVRHFHVREGISRLFEIQLTLLSTNPDIDLDAVIGRAASFTVQGGFDGLGSRSWFGIATAFQQVAAEETGGSTYQMTLSPVLWLLTQRRNHRIFQQQSEVEIARRLLHEWGIVFVERLGETYKKRQYRVQYAESDYAFLCRMLEDAGISFFFETEARLTRLVLHDAPQTAEARPPLPFLDMPLGGHTEHVTGVQIHRRIRPGQYTVQDQDYRQPPAYRLASAAKGGLPVEETLESFHYVPGGFLFQSDKGESTPVADDRGRYRADEGEGASLAARRLAAKRVSSKIVTFRTNAMDLAPGSVLSVLDHPKSELSPDHKLLVTEVVRQGSPNGEWEASCESAGAELDYRPPLATPKPRVAGIETAVVVGPPGEHIHTDELGRVRVQFYWDREGAMDAGSSCWIPLSHPWAGAGYGAVNLPRVGQEVIIDFLGGDPDRPIIVGRVYTGVQKVPYSLPAQKTQSGWKSQTIGGTGYNEIMFDDLPGGELVRIQAERDLTKLVKRNESVTIGHNRSSVVGHDESWVVGHDRSRVVGNSESVLIGNSQSVTIGVNQSITVGADQTITLPAGNQTETITGNRTFTLMGDLTETIVGSSTLTQTGNQDETLLGDYTLLQIGQQTEVQAGGRSSMQLGGRLDVQLGDRKDFQAGGRLDVQLGGTTRIEIGTLSDTVIGSRTDTTTSNATEDVGATKTVNAGSYELTSGPAKIDTGELNVKSSEITVKSGPITVNGGPITVNGGTTTITSGGTMTLKGSLIKLNC